MHTVLVLGAGKIGELVACLLAESGDYTVHLGDAAIETFDPERLGSESHQINRAKLNTNQPDEISGYVKQHAVGTIVSCLPYFCNPIVAEIARELHTHYFDLTEDVSVTKAVTALSRASQTAFVPQCGLAPGFISIVANDLMGNFDIIERVALRVGALPQHANNVLQYALTWSTDGLINEYGNLCEGIYDHTITALQPLEGLEQLEIDGVLYEAFNTSGGLGSLAETYRGKVKQMDYKTIRYPGHCEKIQFLMNDLKLNEDRETLKHILENAIPRTYQDLVIVYVGVRGYTNGVYLEKTYVKKIYPQRISGRERSAIQVTTASGLCAVIDLVLQQPDAYRGFVSQEQFSLVALLNNRFGRYYH